MIHALCKHDFRLSFHVCACFCLLASLQVFVAHASTCQGLCQLYDRGAPPIWHEVSSQVGIELAEKADVHTPAVIAQNL